MPKTEDLPRLSVRVSQEVEDKLRQLVAARGHYYGAYRAVVEEAILLLWDYEQEKDKVQV